MKTCPECFEEALVFRETREDFFCEECGISLIHEGNGFIPEKNEIEFK